MIRRTHTDSRSRRALLSISLSGVLVAGVAVAGIAASGPAAAVDGPTDLITIETTGSSTQVKAYTTGGALVGGPQTLNGKSCAITADAAGAATGSVVSLAGSGANVTKTPGVGVNAGSIGVAEDKSANGQSCSQVNFVSTSTEGLTVKLLNGAKASIAMLDVEVQKDVVVEATLKDGDNPVGTALLYTGLATTTNYPAPSGATKTTCKVGSTSSAPNSNSADNCKWQIAWPSKFDTIVLKARYKGQFSLEGGSDWPGGAASSTGGFPTNATYFWLGELCPSTADPVTITFTGDGTPTGTTLERLPYNADGSPCIKIDAFATQVGNELQMTKEDGQPFAQYLLSTQWVATPGVTAKSTTVDFGLVAAPGSGQVTLPWCPDSLRDPANGALVGLTRTDNPDGNALTPAELAALSITDQDFTDNGLVQYACVYEKSSSYSWSAHRYTITDKIYLLGDVIFRG